MENITNWGGFISDILKLPEHKKEFHFNKENQSLLSKHGRLFISTKKHKTLLVELSYYINKFDIYLYLNKNGSVSVSPNYWVVDIDCNLEFLKKNKKAVKSFIHTILYSPIEVIVEFIKSKPFCIELNLIKENNSFIVRHYLPPYDIFECSFIKKIGFYYVPEKFLKTFRSQRLKRNFFKFSSGELSKFNLSK